MNRRIALVAVVVLLVSLSGCSVLLGGDGPTSTPTPEGTDATPATDEPTGSTPGSGSTPATGGSETPTEDTSWQSFDAAATNANHVDALESAGSFTTESSLVIRNETATRYINGSYAVERGGPAANAANITFVNDGEVSDLPTTTRYTEGETTYERQVQRTDGGTETQYRKGSEPYSDDDPQPVNTTVAYSLGEIARAVLDASRWNRTGTGEFDGAAVTRYDTSGEYFAVGGFGSTQGAATFVVDEQGVVRYVAYRFVVNVGGEPTEYVYEAAYTNVGSTTVEEPSWTDRA